MMRRLFILLVLPVMAAVLPLAARAGSAEGQIPKVAGDWTGTWTVVSSPNVGTSNNALYGVAAASANDVWAVGYYNSSANLTLVEHWNGTAWSVVPSPNVGTDNNQLNGVSAVSANDVWAVGDYGSGSALPQTIHWNGSTWSTAATPSTGGRYNMLFGVAAVSSNDVWAVGYYWVFATVEQVLIEHWDGTQWSIVPSPNGDSNINELYSIASTYLEPNIVWAVGVYRYGPGYWRTLTMRWDGSEWEIYQSSDGASGAPSTSPAAGTSNMLPQISDMGLVVWQYWDGSNWQIEQYNSGNSTTTAITSGGASGRSRRRTSACSDTTP